MSKRAKRGAPQKSCPKCSVIVHARTNLCSCGYSFVLGDNMFLAHQKLGDDTYTVDDIQAARGVIKRFGAVRARRLVDALA